MSYGPDCVYSIESMIDALIGNGWEPVKKTMWRHPDGKRLYRGPYKAYCVMLIEGHEPLTEFPKKETCSGTR